MRPSAIIRPRVASAARLAGSALALGALAVGGFPYSGHAQSEEGEARLELTTDSEAAAQHFWAGIRDQRNVFPAGAAGHFEQALEADPGLGLAIVFHGFVKPGLTDEEREARIAEGLAAMGTASTGERLVGLAVQEWSAGNAASASRLFEAASLMMPGDPWVASFASQLAGARGDETDAITRLERLAASFPDLAHPHNNIAYTEWARGNEGAAMTSVRKYVEMLPEHPNPRDSHAELLQWGGQYPQALAEYENAAQLDPRFDQAYMGAAEVAYLTGDMESARAQITLAIEHAPSAGARVTAMRAMANTYMLEGNRDNAAGQLEQAVAEADGAGLDDARALSHLQAALTAAALGNRSFVAEHLEKAAATGDVSGALHLGFAGIAYAAAGEGTSAREASGALREATEAPFWQDISRTIDAMVDLQEGQAESALEALSEAAPDNPIVQAVLAECYLKTNQPAAAVAQRAEVTGNRQINLANPFWAYAVLRAGAD